MTARPAILTGAAAGGTVPFARPTIEDPARLQEELRAVLDSGMLTDGPRVRALEERFAALTGVNHCVAVSSCTVGLMMVVQAIAPGGEVLVPSFTFSATAHAARWNGATVTFADCDPDTWTLTADQIRSEPDLIIAVHVSGVVADPLGLEKAAEALGARLMFDAAHGAGSLVEVGGDTVPVGRFGTAEVFSLTPTKVLSGAEGGLITTDDAALAEQLRWARNYGNPGDYDTRFAGLNARLSELHAVVALGSLDNLEERVAHRNLMAERYREALGALPGISFQGVPAGSRSSYKDFTVTVEADQFGCDRDACDAALRAEGIETRRYYSPPVHLQAAYRDLPPSSLPTTEALGDRVISLPMWSHLPFDHAERVCDAFVGIHQHAEEIADLVRSGS